MGPSVLDPFEYHGIVFRKRQLYFVYYGIVWQVIFQGISCPNGVRDITTVFCKSSECSTDRIEDSWCSHVTNIIPDLVSTQPINSLILRTNGYMQTSRTIKESINYLQGNFWDIIPLLVGNRGQIEFSLSRVVWSNSGSVLCPSMLVLFLILSSGIWLKLEAKLSFASDISPHLLLGWKTVWMGWLMFIWALVFKY